VTISCNGAYRGAIFVATLFDVKPSTFNSLLVLYVGDYVQDLKVGEANVLNLKFLEGVVALLLKFGMLEGRTSRLKLVIKKLFNNLKLDATRRRLCCVWSEPSHTKFSCHLFLELSRCHCFLYMRYA